MRLFRFRKLVFKATILMAILSFPLPSSADESLLSFRLECDGYCESSCTVFEDFASASVIEIGIFNHSDSEVVEGSTKLSESLAVEVFDSEGNLVSWWEAVDDGSTGVERVWEPGEREYHSLTWPLTAGPFSGDEPDPGPPAQPLVPFDGYRIDMVWRDFDGAELTRRSAFLERIPGSLESWPQHGSRVRFYPQRVHSNNRATVLAQVGCASTPSCARERWLEFSAEGVLKVFVEDYCGPFSALSSYLFAVRLPALSAGSYPVEVYTVGYHLGEPRYWLEASSTLVVSSSPATTPLETE